MEKRYSMKLEDLVSSIFIILMENDSDIKEVSYKQIFRFKDILCKIALERGVCLSFDLTNNDIITSLEQNDKTFYQTKFENGISLRDGVTPYNLIIDYRLYYPFKFLIELLNDEDLENQTLEMIGVSKVEKKKVIDYYINYLLDKINENVAIMDFEKCIIYRDRLRQLQSFKEKKSSKSSGVESKVYTKQDKIS